MLLDKRHLHLHSRFSGVVETINYSSINFIKVDTLSFKTKSRRPEDVERKWYLIDAEGLVVGRLCTQIAHILRGKHLPEYTPHVDCGDNVIVINAEKVRFTGNKLDQKEYIRHTGYPGGQRKETARDLMDRKPVDVIENAVRGMLPKNRLGRAMFRKLYVYTGTEHPHAAQKPEILKP